MERGFGGEGVRGFRWHEVGGYIFGCFFEFFSGRFLGVVLRVPLGRFFWLSGASWGLPGGLPDVIFGRISGISPFWGWL